MTTHDNLNHPQPDGHALPAADLFARCVAMEAQAKMSGAATPRLLMGVEPDCYAVVGLSAAEYHERKDCVSASMLKHALRSPAHYRAALHAVDADTPARRFGRLVHTLVLEPERLDEDYLVWNGGARRGAAFQAVAGLKGERDVITLAELMTAKACAASAREVRGFPLGDWLDQRFEVSRESGEWVATELSIFWRDEATGVSCKARLDAASPTLVIDLKTTGDARGQSFNAEALRMHYDLQAAHYVEAMRKLVGRSPAFLFCSVESAAPYASMVHGTDDLFDDNGRSKRSVALQRCGTSSRLNTWPSYSFDAIQPLTVAPWQAFDAL